MLAIEGTRFGRVEIDPDTVIEFPDGLIGLGGSRYALLKREGGGPFLWLQSLDDPSLALPLANPHRFFPNFTVELTDEDAERLELPDLSTAVDVYVTVRASEAIEEFTANLKAPILIYAGRGHQLINQAPGCELRTPLFPPLELDDREAPEPSAC